jgi:hypothetical protein
MLLLSILFKQPCLLNQQASVESGRSEASFDDVNDEQNMVDEVMRTSEASLGNINVAREVSSHRSTGVVSVGPHGLPYNGDQPSKRPELEQKNVEKNIFLSTMEMCASHTHCQICATASV